MVITPCIRAPVYRSAIEIKMSWHDVFSFMTCNILFSGLVKGPPDFVFSRVKPLQMRNEENRAFNSCC